MDEIEFDFWRHDFYDYKTGRLIQKDLLLVRATRGNVSFQAPIFKKEENEQTIEDVKKLLAMAVEREEQRYGIRSSS